MAAPTATARTTPTGLPLDEGHSTKITFKRYPAVNFWEISIQPPGVDGGDAVEQTTMFNTTWRTKRPRGLKEMTDVSCKAAYDPAVLTTILEMINIEDTVTITFPDGSTWAFYGYLKEFTPDEISEGERPEASITVICTNWDSTNDVEASPTITSVAGT